MPGFSDTLMTNPHAVPTLQGLTLSRGRQIPPHVFREWISQAGHTAEALALFATPTIHT